MSGLQRVDALIYRPGALGDALLALPAAGLYSGGLSQTGSATVRLAANGALEELYGSEIELGGASVLLISQNSPLLLPLFSRKDSADLFEKLGSPRRIIALTKSPPAGFHVLRKNFECIHVIPPTTERPGEKHASTQLAEGIAGRPVEWKEVVETAEAFHLHPRIETGALPRRSLFNADHFPETDALVIHAGAGGIAKRVPLGFLLGIAVEFQERRGRDVAFVVGPAEEDLLGELVESGLPTVFSPPIRMLADWLCSQACFVGADSGPGHLAAFCGLPVVSLFTATEPEVWKPISKTGVVIDAIKGLPEKAGLVKIIDEILAGRKSGK